MIEPSLRVRNATFDLNLIGSEFPDALRWIERPGLICHGHALDLSEALSKIRATVAPLRAGAGVKGKVLASLQAGVPCIMSSVAADGLELPKKLMALVSDDADGIAARMITVHEDEWLHRTVAEEGYAWAEANLAPSRIRQGMEAALFESPASIKPQNTLDMFWEPRQKQTVCKDNNVVAKRLHETV